MLPKYPQLIYQIITNTLKSGLWVIRCRVPEANGYCPCCNIPIDPNDPDPPANTKHPASVHHMFSSCVMVQEVWSEANQLGHIFWSDYTDFNYWEDITLLVHDYEPIHLFKLAVIWSLWRYWCKLFYERDTFDINRLSNMTAEVMMMVRDELIYRLIECRPVIQWLEIADAHRKSNKNSDSSARVAEKHFLLVSTQSIITNPQEFSLPLDHKHVIAWLGNNTMCYIRGKKLVFNHSQWYVFKCSADCNNIAPDYHDSEEDLSSDELGPPGAAFLAHDY